MKYSLRAVDADGTMPGDGLLNEFSSLQTNITFSDIGDSEFEYPVNGANIGKLVQQREIALFDEQGEVPDTRFVLEDRNGNLVSKDGVLYRKWQGRNLWKMFDEAIVYPSDWPTNPSVTGGTAFATATAGQIISSLFNACQARGELTGLTINFGATNDSNASAWSQTISIEYKAGTTLLQVIQDLVDKGVVECRLVGRQFQAYKPNTLGTDRTTTNPQLALWAARNVNEVPEQEISRGLRNAVLVAGDNNNFVEVTDATSIATYNRRTMFLSQSGVTDTGTLSVVGQANIDKVKQPRKERTTAFNITSDLIPQRTFLVGDWLYSDGGGTLERMRVRQAVINANGSDIDGTCALVLNDLFMELEVLLSRKVDSIISGQVMTTDPSGGGAAPDTLAPKIPAGLSVTSASFVNNAGVTQATISASWLQVTQNSDNSVCDDLDYYVLGYAGPTGGFNFVFAPAGTLTAYLSPFPLGSAMQFKVGAYDKSGNFSGFSSVVNLTTATDTTPPPQPKTPVVVPYLGQLRITWDGLGSAGEAMPADFDRLEVHISTASGFAPTTATMIDQLQAAGVSIATGLTYGTTYYVRFVAVDKTGNRSTVSTQASGVPVQVAGADIGNDTLSLTNITFKDLNNFIDDGSFELAATRAQLSTRANPVASWSFNQDVSSARHGDWRLIADLSVNPSHANKYYNLRASVPTKAGEVWYVRCPAYSYFADGGLRLFADFTLQDNTVTTVEIINLAAGYLPYTDNEATFVAPANAKSFRLYLKADATGTGGTWAIDAVELRQVMGTVLIQDAAITNAKIGSLAVNDAKIASVSAGKITVGTLAADITVSARIKTADTGARVEINSSGIRAYNSGGTQTVGISSSDGSVDISGKFRTGLPGANRTEISSSTGGNTGGIGFWDYTSAAGVGTEGTSRIYMSGGDYLDIYGPGGHIQLQRTADIYADNLYHALLCEAIQRDGNVYMSFHWNGQGGQPSWLWGGNDGANMYVYNPSNFSVNNSNLLVTGNGAPIQVNGTTSVITTTAASANAYWNSAGVLVKATSASRFKQDIVKLVPGKKARGHEKKIKYDPQGLHEKSGHVWDPKALLSLDSHSWRAVDGDYSDSHFTWVSFIADHVAEALPFAAMYDQNGEVENYNDRAIQAAHNDLIKELFQRVEALEASK